MACLVLLALPLQGALAASMALCLPAVAGEQQVAVHDDVQAGGHAHHHATHEAATGDAPAAPDADHQCGVCAFCGHALGLARAEPVLAVAPAPQSPVAAPPTRLDTRGLPVPDKPPRA